jgi:hypothetical protein
MSMNTKILKLLPNMVSDKQIEDIVNLLESGGESYMVDIENKLRNKTEIIVLAYLGEDMVGVRVIWF